MRLLQFVTGTCRLPVGGFRELAGKILFSQNQELFLIGLLAMNCVDFSVFSLAGSDRNISYNLFYVCLDAFRCLCNLGAHTTFVT